jgi:hypothetical protein
MTTIVNLGMRRRTGKKRRGGKPLPYARMSVHNGLVRVYPGANEYDYYRESNITRVTPYYDGATLWLSLVRDVEEGQAYKLRTPKKNGEPFIAVPFHDYTVEPEHLDPHACEVRKSKLGEGFDYRLVDAIKITKKDVTKTKESV